MIENPYKNLIIIGGGRSIGNFNFKILDNYFTFGLNHACRIYNPTTLLWLDQSFYSENKENIDDKQSVKITKATNQGKLPLDTIKIKYSEEYYKEKGLEKGLWKGKLGGLVGLFALSLGTALSFEEIYLLGYDMTEVKEKTHFHNFNEHGKEYHMRTYRDNLKYFNVYQNCKGIYNVSPESAIKVFPKIDYLEFTDKVKKMKPIDQEEAKKWLIKCLTQ